MKMSSAEGLVPKALRVFALVLILSYAGTAAAGNLDSFYLGNDAAMQAGAITADADASSGIWYNPAGLAGMQGTGLDVSASAYALRLNGNYDIEADRAYATVSRLVTTDFLIVPNAMTLTRKVGKVGLGLGVFVPNQRVTFLRTRVQQPEADGLPGVDLAIDYYERLQEYFGGPSIGWRAHPKVDVGMSLLVHYRNELSIGASQISFSQSGAVLQSTTHQTLDWQQVGIQPAFGVQWQLMPRWRMGIALHLPSLRLFNIRQVVQLGTANTSNTATGDAYDQVQFKDDSGLASQLIAPARFHAGLSHEFGKLRLAVEANYQTPFHNTDLDVFTKAVVNVRIGGHYRASDTWQFGGGLFTDRSAAGGAPEIGDRRLDYYGITLSSRWLSPYRLAPESDAVKLPPRALVFGTTMAFTYAIGIGDLLQAKIGGREVLAGVPTRTIAHELMLHVGTSLTN